MKSAQEIEIDFGLPPGSITVSTDQSGGAVATLAGGEVFETECPLWALRCVCTRKGFDAAINAGIAALNENQRTAAHAQWNYGGDKLSRSDVLVRQIRGWVGYNQRQMDRMFSAAAALGALR